jgi:hypothetical protein
MLCLPVKPGSESILEWQTYLLKRIKDPLAKLELQGEVVTDVSTFILKTDAPNTRKGEIEKMLLCGNILEEKFPPSMEISNPVEAGEVDPFLTKSDFRRQKSQSSPEKEEQIPEENITTDLDKTFGGISSDQVPGSNDPNPFSALKPESINKEKID